MKATDYPLLVVWSEEDQAYLASVFDLPGCVADGGTQEEAVANAQVVIQEWIETAREVGRDVPKPSDFVAMQASFEKAAEEQRKEFEEAVHAAAKVLVEQYVERQKTERRFTWSYAGRRVLQPA